MFCVELHAPAKASEQDTLAFLIFKSCLIILLIVTADIFIYGIKGKKYAVA